MIDRKLLEDIQSNKYSSTQTNQMGKSAILILAKKLGVHEKTEAKYLMDSSMESL